MTSETQFSWTRFSSGVSSMVTIFISGRTKESNVFSSVVLPEAIAPAMKIGRLCSMRSQK